MRIFLPGGFGFPLGFGAGIGVTMVAVAAGAASHHVWSVLALAATTAAVSSVTTVPAALATAAACWCLHSGFVLGRYGQLVFTREALEAAALFVVAALLAVTVRPEPRPARGRPSWWQGAPAPSRSDHGRDNATNS